jgi:hypothetical protein
MASAPFKCRMRDRGVAKVLLPSWRWEQRIVLFQELWCFFRKIFGWAAVKVFFSSIFSLSFSRKTHLNLKKKQLCPLVCNLIVLVLLILITVYLAFDTF